MIVDPYGEKAPGGLGRFIYETAKALLAADTKNTYTVYLKDEPRERPALPGSRWSYQTLRSRYLFLTGAYHMDRRLDVYIFFTPVIPLFFRPKKSVVVALDFAYLHYADSLGEKIQAGFLYLIHRRSVRMASKIIAISEETKREVVRLFGVHPSRIEVVYLSSVDLGAQPRALPVPAQFFLFAGMLKARKNVAGIIEAFAEFAKSDTNSYQLLIDGKKGGKYYDSLVQLVAHLGIGEWVRFLGYVSDAELAYLYSKARALVFVSFIEGFGMPVLEAMHAQLPVITSHSGALAEVAGNAALLVDPHNPQDIARGMRELASNDGLRNELIRKGKLRAHECSWDKTARHFLEIITQLERTDGL